MPLLFTLLFGIATGMRTMTPIAVLCWAAYLGWLPVQHTWAFWTANIVSVIVFTAAALGEYVGDTLPRTPSRTDLPLVAARVSFGLVCGLIVAAAMREPKVGGALFGAAGALIGTYAGYRVRMRCARWIGSDLPVALTESALALGITYFALGGIRNQLWLTGLSLARWH